MTQMNSNKVAKFDLSGRYIATCLFACLAWAVANSARTSVGTTLVAVQREMHLSDIQLGLATSFSVVAIILLAIPAGLIADNFSRRALLVIGLLITCFANTLRFLASTSEMFIAAGFVDGMGCALLFVTLASIIARLSPMGRGAVVGAAIGGAAMLGGMSMLVAGVVASQQFGWRIPIAGAALTALALAVVVLLMGKDVNKDASSTDERPLRRDALTHLIVANAALWMLAISVGSFGASLVMRLHDAPITQVAGLLGFWSLWLVPLFAVIGGILTAWLCVRDLRHTGLLMMVATIVMVLALLLGTNAPTPSLSIFGFSLLRATSSFLFASMLTMVACAVVRQKRGLIAGIVLASCYAAQLVGPLLLGKLSDSFRHLGRGEGLQAVIQWSAVIAGWALIHLWLAFRSVEDGVEDDSRSLTRL